MARAKRLSDVRRMLMRKLQHEPDSALESLRNELWDLLIMRDFLRGRTVENLAKWQPARNSTDAIEAAMRRRVRAEGR